jgi:hypothetical protein
LGSRLVEGDEYVKSIFAGRESSGQNGFTYKQVIEALERAYKKQTGGNHPNVEYIQNIAKDLFGRLSSKW